MKAHVCRETVSLSRVSQGEAVAWGRSGVDFGVQVDARCWESGKASVSFIKVATEARADAVHGLGVGRLP